MNRIIQEYEQILIGNKTEFPADFFRYGKSGNEQVALILVQYAVEYLLQWTPEQAQQFFTPEIAKKMKLNQVLKHITLPDDIDMSDTSYIITLLYPKLHHDRTESIQETYKQIVSGEKKRYEKNFMFGYPGLVRANLCLRYALSKKSFNSVRSLYQFMASDEGMAFLKDYHLYPMYKYFYNSSLDYLHNSLDITQRKNFYYGFFSFWQAFKKKYNVPPTFEKITELL